MSEPSALRECVILLAEDDPIIGSLLQDLLEDAGATVIGPFPSLRQAEAALAFGMPAMALLDVNLVDGDVFPLAKRLQECAIPYVLFSASDPALVPDSLKPRRFLAKPASSRDILAAVTDMLGRA
ncbi:response regulator [Luteibacter aegosomatis]|uniref:response regulator n=1 Tax=Luteibacter aegosomatis TaxID=2911537 RepID=UPI001FF96739|nr:response regulator [Luteibacter aegosomatis]UPG87652.1 response regulator [Luteibacter aegosomatis]